MRSFVPLLPLENFANFLYTDDVGKMTQFVFEPMIMKTWKVVFIYAQGI